jgi:GAF domain-containing protein
MPYQATNAEFTDFARELARLHTLDAVLNAITRRAVETVAGAETAAITIKRGTDKYVTVAPTSEFAVAVDRIQYETSEGPCLDSLEAGHVFRSDDVATDPRWPTFGPKAAADTAVVSMLSHRLFIEDDTILGALNLYSRRPAAFAEHNLSVLDKLATHSAIALVKANAEEQNGHLRAALDSNRRIGVAMGVIMATYKTTDDQAFDLLRMASQHSHRKLRDVAEDVIITGALELER